MPKVLITAFGSTGDVLPFVWTGGELQRRGYDVTLLTNPYFERHAVEAGISLCPIGTVSEYHDVMNDSDLFNWKKVTWARLDNHFSRLVEPVYQAVVKLHAPGRTVMFTKEKYWSGDQWIASEKCRIPIAVGLVAPSRLPSKYDPPYPSRPLPWSLAPLAHSREGLRLLYDLQRRVRKISRILHPVTSPPGEYEREGNRIRALAQLDPFENGPESSRYRPQLQVCMWPSWFAEKQSDWPSEAITTNFPFPPGNVVQKAPSSQDSGQKRPLVFTAGSVASQQQAFFRNAVGVCRNLERPGILVTPHGNEIALPLPSFMTHQLHAPFEELFPRSALVVHHGGVGTLSLALSAGVPQIVRPLMGEQFDLGHRMEKLGVGNMIVDENASSERLSRRISYLLQSENVQERCRYWQCRVNENTGISAVADSIENLCYQSLRVNTKTGANV